MPRSDDRLDSGAYGRELARPVTAWTAKTVWILRHQYLGLSSRDFARTIGVSAALVSKWEKQDGKVHPAHARILELLKRASPGMGQSVAFRDKLGKGFRGDPVQAFLILIGWE